MAREQSKIQRQNPVPPGRYWLDVPHEKFKVWDALVERNKGALQIDHHETTTRAPEPYEPSTPGMPVPPTPELDNWYIIFITAPVAWPKELSPPNTAPDWIKQRSDVYQRPDDPRLHPIDTAAQAAADLAEAAKRAAREAAEQFERAAGAAALIALIWWGMNQRRNR